MMPLEPVVKRRRRWCNVVAALLLVAHYALAVGSKFTSSTTSDELVHLTAGFSYWKNHDYRLHPENGILPQRWAAIPTWLRGATFPELKGNDYWRTSDVWVVGHQFFYETGEDHFPRLMAGRAMIALFSVGTGVLIFLWSRHLFGDLGAICSLAFFSFSPDFLAHGALVTSDACMTFFFLAAASSWWWAMNDGRVLPVFISAVTFGFAFIAKYSAVLLIPMIIVMAIARSLHESPMRIGKFEARSVGRKLALGLVAAAIHVGVVAAIIWAAYGFRFAAFNPALPPADHFIQPWSLFDPQTGLLGRITKLAADYRLLPEAFLYGFEYVIATARFRAAFLNGQYGIEGWPTFFLWTFILKSTLATILACILILAVWSRQWIKKRLDTALLYSALPLIVLFTVYWMASITSHLNIGHRHILPIYPVLFVAAGTLASRFSAKPLQFAAWGLLGWHAVESIRIYPHHLAYFNALAGGPQNGWRHLVDSSLDWGQDLPALRQWLQQNGADTPMYLCYFGSGSPSYYHINARRIAEFNNFKFPPAYIRLEAGIYCVSATMLQQVYSPFRGDWTRKKEQRYQQLRTMEPEFAAFARDPVRKVELLRAQQESVWRDLIREHDLLRMARLCHFLRVRPPDSDAGHSLLIYRLSADEIDRAVNGSLKEWSSAIEHAVRGK